MDKKKNINKKDRRVWGLSFFGVDIEFPTRKQYDRYMKFHNLFIPNPVTGKVPHTNMESPVRLTKDNPLTNGKSTIDPKGSLVNVVEIPEDVWKKKYENVNKTSGFFRKVAAVDPHGPQIKAAPRKIIPKSIPPQTSVLGGSPQSPAQIQPNNARYEQNAYSQLTGTNVPCNTCEGVANQWGAEVYKCMDGSGPYYFSNVTVDGGQEFPASAVGKSYVCNPSYGSQPGGDCHASTCWGPVWYVTQRIPTGQIGPGSINTSTQSHMCVDLVCDCNCASFQCNCIGATCASPGQPVIASPSSAAAGCEVVQMFFSDGSNQIPWLASRGAFLTYDSINAPGVGIQLMGEQAMSIMVGAYAQLAPFNFGPGAYQGTGSVAKIGNKVYGWLLVAPAGNPASTRYEFMELTIDAGLTTLAPTNIYQRLGGPQSNLAGNSLCAKNSTTFLTILGGASGQIEQIVINPATNPPSFTNTTLFLAVDNAGGDMVYDPSTDTIWNGEQGDVIRHYDMAGNVLGVVATTGTVWRMWCQAGEVIYWTPTGGTNKIDKVNYTAISLFGTMPLMTTQPGDAASSPDCCIGGGAPPSGCAPAQSI